MDLCKGSKKKMKFNVLELSSIYRMNIIRICSKLTMLPNHDKLTELWEPVFYKIEISTGTCDICLGTDTDTISQIGCQKLYDEYKIEGLNHGLCFDCIHGFIKYSTGSIGKSHKCIDGTDHECTISIDGINTFLKTQIQKLQDPSQDSKIDGEEFQSVQELKKILAITEERMILINEIKQFKQLCGTCKCYNDKLKDKAEVPSICPGCQSFMTLENTNACSMITCGNCSGDGVCIKICAYCHFSTCGVDTIYESGVHNGIICIDQLRKGHKLPRNYCTCV